MIKHDYAPHHQTKPLVGGYIRKGIREAVRFTGLVFIAYCAFEVLLYCYEWGLGL